MLELRSPSELIKTLDFAHTAATTSKTPVLVNSVVFIPLHTAAANAANGYAYETEISDAPMAAVTVAVGDAIYWDNANSVFTNVASGNTLCGHALEAAASGGNTGLIAFNSFA